MILKDAVSKNQMIKILNFTQSLHKQTIIPSFQLQNILHFVNTEIVSNKILNFCSIQKPFVNKQFKRAFRSMNKYEKVLYYSKYMKLILNEIRNNEKNTKSQLTIQNILTEQDLNNPTNIKKQNKFQQIVILLKRQKQQQRWVKSKIQIASQLCVLRLVQTGEQIDLHYYLLRSSNSKQKSALVFEATQDLVYPKTIRFSNYNQSIQQLRKKLDYYLDKCLIQKIKKYLKNGRHSYISQTSRTSIRTSMDLNQQNIDKNIDLLGELSIPATVVLINNHKLKSLRKIICDRNQIQFEQTTLKKIHQKLINKQILLSLQNFTNFEQIEHNLYFNKKSNITRKLFTFNSNQMNYQQLIKHLNNHKQFKKWKKSLYLINLLAQLPHQNTKIYHQIDLYKDYTQVDYVYLRHLFEIQNITYFYDQSINTQQYGSVSSNLSRGNIQYGIWRIKSTNNTLQILVEISLTNIKSKNIQQIMNQYIGNIQLLKNQYKKQYQKTVHWQTYKTVYNQNQSNKNAANLPNCNLFKKGIIFYQNLEQSTPKKYKIGSTKTFNNLKSEQFFSIKNQSISSFPQSQFFSIKTLQIDQQVHQKRQNQKDQLLSQLNSIQEFIIQQQKPLQKNYLNEKHIVDPKKNKKNKKLKQVQQGHFLWKNQWKITQKGQLVNINVKQIQVQSSVLKLVLKKIGKNLLSGKSILNISLPIQIFGTDSNLQRLCKSMSYAPIFLQKVAQNSDPIQRMKGTICFGIGYSIYYIQMQKPFNPILGQTYQGIIDGCPVYGQQISHHPPISSIFLKGRGFYAYGNFEAKVDMGMNSASGINEGFMNVAFSKNNPQQNVIKFNCPPGEISGLVYGDRKLTLIKKSYYYDEENLLLAIVNWGGNKKKNQISHFNDYLDGKIIKLKQKIDIKKIQKIKENNLLYEINQFKGRWTGDIVFDNKVQFKIQSQSPCFVQQQHYPLPSNTLNRTDIMLRKQLKWNEAQSAKQKLEQIQRNDRKLREKFYKNS